MIELRDVQKRFGDNRVLQGVNLSIASGSSMVIIGGSGNNWGAILGAFLIWFLWIKVEPWGNALMWSVTQGMDDTSTLKHYLIDSAAQMRTITMGVILLLVLRFSPRGLIPER